MIVAVNRQALLSLPSMYRTNSALQIAGNLFPGVEPVGSGDGVVFPVRYHPVNIAGCGLFLRALGIATADVAF